MTESFQKWCESLQMYSEHVQGDAHFWLSAFVQQVMDDANLLSCKTVSQTDYVILNAFKLRVREFGLDGGGEDEWVL